MLVRIRTYRFISRLLVAFFAVSAIGVNVDIHFCQGHFAGVKLISSDSDTQPTSCCATVCSDDTEDKGCCDDKELSAAMDYDGPTFVSAESDDKVTAIMPINGIKLVERVSGDRHDLVVLSDTGPPLTGYAIRVRYQSFLC